MRVYEQRAELTFLPVVASKGKGSRLRRHHSTVRYAHRVFVHLRAQEHL
jgi:hypothetical protein